MKHNSPRERKHGKSQFKCRVCGQPGAHIKKYGLHLCRMCFRESAISLGFKKYN